ncbi:MAG: hypothetical protein KDB63_18500 [Nocardioidaceae bacterium]|nr:hypothetical protein [Nocardioidaceae bacterium]
MPHSASTYRDLAERAWSWVLSQVREGDEGLWLPEHPGQQQLPDFPYDMHSGVGGLAHVLAEIGLTRPLADGEVALAEGIAQTVSRRVPTETEYGYFDGLVSTLGVLLAIGASGVPVVVERLTELATPDGWRPSFLGPPETAPDPRVNDVTLGTAAVLVGALWADKHDVAGAGELADRAADILLAEAEDVPTGLDWGMVPRRFAVGEPRRRMPNWSHGLAGIAGALAAAGVERRRPDWVDAARRGAEHLVTLGDTSDGGFRVPHVIPGSDDLDTFTYSWCHGPTGTSLLFAALDRAGVPEVAGRTPGAWERACLHSVRLAGVPERRSPGFWDNDGRCCGTAGVGDVVLNLWQRHGEDRDLDFATVLGDALVERAIADGDQAYWRFVEHRNEDPLLPPGIGWMQGAAGIAAYLFRIGRILDHGRQAPAVARMDTWWALPEG